MKSITTLICLISFSLNGISQFKFQDEESWKYAFDMIYQANLGNCQVAHEMLDSLQQDENFKHSNSFLALAKCLQKGGKTEKADSLMAKARQKMTFNKIPDEKLITHPELRERFLLMYMEDQGRWSIKDEFIIDPEVKESIIASGVDYSYLVDKVRRLSSFDLHKLHIKEIEKIIDQEGFPTYEMIGFPAMQGVKVVILHGKLEILEKYQDGFEGQFGMKRMAYLIDKMRVAKKEMQVYGTQGDNSENGVVTFYPIEDESNVNKRRMEAGLEPIEIYAKVLGIKDYEIPVENR